MALPIIRTIISFIISLLLSFQAYGLVKESEREMMGPSVGGGGDALILSDDSVVLADAWLDFDSSQPDYPGQGARALHPKLRKNISRYEKIVSGLGVVFSANQRFPKGDIVKQLQLLEIPKKLKIFAVANAQELNRSCDSGGQKKYALSGGISVMQVACTIGDRIYIVEPIFKRLSLKEQTLLLIHERLTTLRDVAGGKNYSAIARFTSGLRVYAAIYREQERGKFRRLSKSEVKTLTNFYQAYEELEIRQSELDIDSFDYIPHENGGGLVHSDALIAESAFVGLSTYLLVTRPANVVIRENAILNNVRIAADAIEISAGARVVNSRIAYITEERAGYDLFIASQENIVGQNIDVRTSHKYFPYGVKYKNIPQKVIIPSYKIKASSRPYNLVSPIPDPLYVEHVDVKDLGRANIFSSDHVYQMTHSFVFTYDSYFDSRDSLNGGKLMMITKDGKLIRAGLPKEFFWHITAPGSQSAIQELIPRAECVAFTCKVSPQGEY